MENFLLALLGKDAFGGPGGPGGLGDVGPADTGLLGDAKTGLASMGKAMQAITPPQGQKPIMNAGVSGAGLPFQVQLQDLINPAMNGMAQRRAQTPTLPTLGQLLSGQ